MRTLVPLIIVILALSACGSATSTAQGGSADAGVAVDAAWIRAANRGTATAPASAEASGMSEHQMGDGEAADDSAVSAGYMTLRNTGSQADRLLGASSDAAGEVQLHLSEMNNNVMSMQQVQAIDLPAGQTVALAEGGYHLMLLNLKRDLAPGDTVKLTLRFERAATVELEVPVRASAPDDE